MKKNEKTNFLGLYGLKVIKLCTAVLIAFAFTACAACSSGGDSTGGGDSTDGGGNQGSLSCQEDNAQKKCEFVSKWNTGLTDEISITISKNNQIKLPLVEGGRYDFTVDWGDGTPTTNVTAFDTAADEAAIYTATDDTVTDAAHIHTYNTSDDYTITITGTIEGWRFKNGDNSAHNDDYRDAPKLLNVTQWGSLSLGDTDGYQFFGARNFEHADTNDAPGLEKTTSLANAFAFTENFNGKIENWNVSKVRNFKSMFQNAINFNRPLAKWADKLTSVENVSSMFNGASKFNQDLSSWEFPANITGADSYDNSADAWEEKNKPTFQ